MSRSSPESAILDAAKRMQSFNALTQLVTIPWDDIDPQERNHWIGLACAALRGGHAQTPADTYRETVRKVAATREKRRAELQEAVVAAHAAFEAIPIGFPLQQNGRTIDHTLLNEAKRLCELALSDTSTVRTCDHDWKIWPETDGHSQRCMKCGAYRDTPTSSPERK